MFGSKKPSSSGNSTAPSTASHSLNSIVAGTEVEGKIKAKSDFRVDGTIKGDLICESKVIIGPNGKVSGDIKCKNAMIEGHFDGNLTVSDLLNIREKASVSGKVRYGKLIVQPGATLEGDVRLVGSGNGQGKLDSKAANNSNKIAGKAKIKETVN